MNRFLLLIVIFGSTAVYAQDITTLEKIGAVVSLQRSDKGVTLNNRDLDLRVVVAIERDAFVSSLQTDDRTDLLELSDVLTIYRRTT